MRVCAYQKVDYVGTRSLCSRVAVSLNLEVSHCVTMRTLSSGRSTVAVLDRVESLKCLWYLHSVEVRYIHYKSNIKPPPGIGLLMFPGETRHSLAHHCIGVSAPI